MKRRIAFLVAAMAATATSPALAQQDPGKMFMINAVTPGVVSFSGEGTATFNNSSSTANSFSVGSSSNFGVNASVSSTPDYAVDSNALFKLAGTSQLQQTIGTSSSAANTQAASEAAATAASTIANSRTTAEFGQNWDDFKARQGTTTGPVDIANPNGTGTIKTEEAYKAAKQEYNDKQVSDAYSAVTTAATSSSSSGSSGQGIIEGNFLTTNSSRSSIGATASSSVGNTAAATATVEEKMGKDYSSYSSLFASFAGTNGKIDTAGEIAAAKAAGIEFNASSTGSGTTAVEAGSKLSENSYNSTKQQKIDSVFSELQRGAASQGSADSKSEAVVQVKGVGSIATLNASADSAFNVDVLTRLRSSIPDNNGTANGSAGGNLATSSFANQSNSQTASAFMQAFGADTVQLNANSSGGLDSATINGRFNVTLDAAGSTPAKVALPSAN